MAADAAILKNRRDVLGIGNIAVPGFLTHPPDVASFSLRHRVRHLFPGQQFIKRSGEVALRRPGARETDAVLIIDAPAVAYQALFIEDENLWRPHGADLV